MSPVRNQPSRNASRVSSGRCQYSRQTAGPRTSSSPGVPSATSLPVLVDETDIDARQRLPDEARPPLAGERIRQRHAELGHAVPLEQRVAGDVAPALERLHRKRRGAGHHQSQPARALRSRPLHVGRRGVPRRDQPVVDRRHRGEDGDLARREPTPDDLGIERRQDLARRANRERRAQAVDDAVDVVQRQREQQTIGRASIARPRRATRSARRCSDAWTPRPSAGRSCRSCRRSSRGGSSRGAADRRPASPASAALVVTKRARAARASGVSIGRGRRIADDHRRARVANHVLELRRRMRHGQRHGHAAGAPDPALHGGVREARRHQKRHARLVQVGVVAEQRAGHAPRRIVELLVGERAVGGDDRRSRDSAHGGRRIITSYMALIDPGKKAPAFALKDQKGETHRLSDYEGRPVILYFYPKDDTPGCTQETCEFQARLPSSSRPRPPCSGVSILDEKSKAKFAEQARHHVPAARRRRPRGRREIRRVAGEVTLRPQVHGHRPHDVSHRAGRQGRSALGQREGRRPRRGGR